MNSDISVVFDYDSTIVTGETLTDTIEMALEELAGSYDTEQLQAALRRITDQGNNGELAFRESLSRRIGMGVLYRRHIEQTRKRIVSTITPGFETLVSLLREESPRADGTDKGSNLFIVSSGFMDHIEPAAEHLGIPLENCFGNTFRYDEDGKVIGFDEDNPLSRGGGKIEVIRGLKKEDRLTGTTIMVGDGSNDLDVYKAGEVDTFVGFGGNKVREAVRAEAQHYCMTVGELTEFFKSHVLERAA